MFALVDGQQLILGPIAFNYRLINSVLEEDLGVNYVVNSLDYQNVPINVTDVIKILPTEIETPSYDSKFEYLSDPTYQILTDKVIFTYQKKTKSLEQVKEEYKNQVPTERWRRENTTIINHDLNGVNIQVSTSRDSRASLMSKMICSSENFNYKLNDGTWVNISLQDLRNILMQIDQKVQEYFDWEKEITEQIDACKTCEEVYSIKIIPEIELFANSFNSSVGISSV